jgi:septum formation inhibitor MinC
MIKLDDNLLQELGLGALQPEEKKKMLAHIYETLEMRVGMELAKQMTDAQLSEFEEFINRNDEAGALRWLETNFPNYKDVVAAEFEKLKQEIRQVAPQILMSSQQQSQAMPMPQDAQQAATPQQPQQQYAPQQQPAAPYAAPAPQQYGPQPMPGQQYAQPQAYPQQQQYPQMPQQQQAPYQQPVQDGMYPPQQPQPPMPGQQPYQGGGPAVPNRNDYDLAG